MTKNLLLVLLLSGCGPMPRCVVRGVAIHGGTFECSEVEEALVSAELELGFDASAGSITFRSERTWLDGDDVVNGLAWCRPFEMELGSGALQSPESAMAHELAHWMTGCSQAQGGHEGWSEAGITAAIHRWTLRARGRE